ARAHSTLHRPAMSPPFGRFSFASFARILAAMRFSPFLVLTAFGFSAILCSQTANSGSQPAAQQAPSSAPQAAPAAGGVDTGPPQPAQFDAQRRPITAGGFVA